MAARQASMTGNHNEQVKIPSEKAGWLLDVTSQMDLAGRERWGWIHSGPVE